MKHGKGEGLGLSHRSLIFGIAISVISYICSTCPWNAANFVNVELLRKTASWKPAFESHQRNITLVTQLSLSRLPALQLQCSTWPFSLTAALYAPTVNKRVVSSDPFWDNLTLAETQQRINTWIVNSRASGRCNLFVDLYIETYDERAGALVLYPINALRNAALREARTDIVFILDVDFVPHVPIKWQSEQGYQALLKTLARGYAVVVPTFELLEQSPQSWEGSLAVVSQGRAAVVESLRNGTLIPYRLREYEQFETDIAVRIPTIPTLPTWATATSAYLAHYAPGWEPFFIYNRSQLPEFDERFRGYGKNKIVFFQHVATLGVLFVVSLDAFALHLWHPPTPRYNPKLQRETYERNLHYWRVTQSTLDEMRDMAESRAVAMQKQQGSSEDGRKGQSPDTGASHMLSTKPITPTTARLKPSITGQYMIKNKFPHLLNREENIHRFVMPQKGKPTNVQLLDLAAHCAHIDTNIRKIREWSPDTQPTLHIRTSSTRDENKVTLVTQLSLDRLDRLRLQCSIWPGSISAVVYAPFVNNTVTGIERSVYDRDSLDVLDRKLSYWYNAIVEDDNAKCELKLQLFVEDFISRRESCGNYPYNALRNRALDAATTEAVFLLDVDFMPHAATAVEWHTLEGYSALMKLLEDHVVVVPVFEPETEDLELGTHLAYKIIHGTKGDVTESLLKREMKVFLSPYAHGNTNSRLWLNSSEPYLVQYNWYYEPFIVLQKEFAPWFDERFTGYGYDRIMYHAHLALSGVQIAVHPRAFAIHAPHEKSLVLSCTHDDPGRFVELLAKGEAAREQVFNGTYTPQSSLCRTSTVELP